VEAQNGGKVQWFCLSPKTYRVVVAKHQFVLLLQEHTE
jgi:hypothetical protein